MSSEKRKIFSEFERSIRRELSEIKKIVAQNQHEIKELRRFASRMDSFVFWVKVKGFIKLALILIPIVLAYFFVIPRLAGWIHSVRELLKTFFI